MATDTKLHSIAAVLHERVFSGEIEDATGPIPFSYAPASVAVADGKIVLTGRFVAGPKSADGVRATLAATQGELGTPPRVRRELLAGTAQGAKTTTPDVEEAGHTTGDDAQKQPQAEGPTFITEKTGKDGYVGVMYLKLSPLDGKALGVPGDLSAVQLNARFSTTSDTERELQWLFSGLVTAVLGDRRDAKSADAHVAAINGMLKA